MGDRNRQIYRQKGATLKRNLFPFTCLQEMYNKRIGRITDQIFTTSTVYYTFGQASPAITNDDGPEFRPPWAVGRPLKSVVWAAAWDSHGWESVLAPYCSHCHDILTNEVQVLVLLASMNYQIPSWSHLKTPHLYLGQLVQVHWLC